MDSDDTKVIDFNDTELGEAYPLLEGSSVLVVRHADAAIARNPLSAAQYFLEAEGGASALDPRLVARLTSALENAGYMVTDYRAILDGEEKRVLDVFVSSEKALTLYFPTQQKDTTVGELLAKRRDHASHS